MLFSVFRTFCMLSGYVVSLTLTDKRHENSHDVTNSMASRKCYCKFAKRKLLKKQLRKLQRCSNRLSRTCISMYEFACKINCLLCQLALYQFHRHS